MARNQSGGEGGHFVGEEHMGEVERDAEVRPVDLPNCEQRPCDVGHQAERSRLVRLVFDADVDRRIVVGDLTDSLDCVFP